MMSHLYGLSPADFWALTVDEFTEYLDQAADIAGGKG